MLCGGHVKYYDPSKLKTDEEIEESLKIRKLKIFFENRKKEGFVCYTCLGKIFAEEVLKEASPSIAPRLPSKQSSE